MVELTQAEYDLLNSMIKDLEKLTDEQKAVIEQYEKTFCNCNGSINIMRATKDVPYCGQCEKQLATVPLD